MTTTVTALAGWVGAGCLLLAYALLSTGRISTGPLFQSLNLGGALALALNAASHQAWPSVTLNLAWLLIGLATMYSRQQLARPLLRPRRFGVTHRRGVVARFFVADRPLDHATSRDQSRRPHPAPELGHLMLPGALHR